MESTRQKQTLLAAMWLLIAVSLLMLITSLFSSRGQYAEELKALDKRLEQLEADLSKLEKQVESSKDK